MPGPCGKGSVAVQHLCDIMVVLALFGFYYAVVVKITLRLLLLPIFKRLQ